MHKHIKTQSNTTNYTKRQQNRLTHCRTQQNKPNNNKPKHNITNAAKYSKTLQIIINHNKHTTNIQHITSKHNKT